MLKTVVILAMVALSVAQDPIPGECQCGVFVSTMFPWLSNIEPLTYINTRVQPDGCGVTSCRGWCTTEAENFDFTFDPATGQEYCQRIYALIPSDVVNEPLFVSTRLPECFDFTVWNGEVYASNVNLCCSGGDYLPCV